MATISDTFTLLVESVTSSDDPTAVDARIWFTLPDEADDTVKVNLPGAGETTDFSAPFSYILGLPKMSGPFSLTWTKGGGTPTNPPSAFVTPPTVQHERRDTNGNVVVIDTYFENMGIVSGTISETHETGSYIANLSALQV